MPSRPVPSRPWLLAVLLGLAAFLVLTLRYSPNWVAFGSLVREATADVTTPATQAAVESAILSGFSARGLHVIRQARDLSTEISDSTHKIVRWRLLPPAVGHLLGLPAGGTLALAHLGCLAWLVALTALGLHLARAAGRPAWEAASLALVAGASAPFFASMGLLGYYDSWLVLALLAAAFAPSRAWVIAVCVLAPWVDERFVIGLPLALLVRWLRLENGAGSAWPWLRREALVPLVLTCAYAALRLWLGGSGSSQTVAEYLRQFVLNPRISAGDRLFGAWSGLLAGWVLVAAAVALVGTGRREGRTLRMGLLAAAVAATGLAGLFTALDLSRSMALLTPVVPLGWSLASRHAAWRRGRVALLLPLATLVVPAYHVMGSARLEVDDFFGPSVPLLTAQNNLGLLYDQGREVARDLTKAVRWYRSAADHGHAEALNNLASKYIKGEGVPQDFPRALELLKAAIRQDNLSAIYNYGFLHAEGIAVPRDYAIAAHWFRRAADRGQASAMNNLGALYLDGAGVTRDPAEAIRWFTRAVAKGLATGARNLGKAYQSGAAVPRDLITAYQWFLIGDAMGDGPSGEAAAALETALGPAERAEARRRAQAAVLELQRSS